MKYLLIFIVAALCFFRAADTVALPGADSVLEYVNDGDLVRKMVVDSSLFDNKKELLDRVVQTLYYLETAEALSVYETHFKGAVSLASVRESLHRFYLILLLSSDLETFTDRIQSSFALYRSIGEDGRGRVRFTGYFQPVYAGSRTRTNKYRFPLFKKPAEFDSWKLPHPTRVALEGYRGLGGAETILHGNELVWLKSRFDVFMVQVQGSAIIELTDGSAMSVGFAAGTEYPFSGISRAFLQKHNVAWHRLGNFFDQRPELLDEILARNNRFILFEEKPDPHAIGSLGVPVLAERSIATDKLKLPPGAVALIRTRIPERDKTGSIVLRDATRFVLNLDTGSALKGPGRVDIFMGTGEDARVKASSVYATGELYYLFLDGLSL